MTRNRIFRAVASLLVLALVLPGCATLPKGPTPEMRAAFGTIGVSRALFPPSTEFFVPAKGRPEGAVRGAATAFAAVMKGGLQAVPAVPGRRRDKFPQWTADNGALLGRAYEEGYRKIAAGIGRRIFLDVPAHKK